MSEIRINGASLYYEEHGNGEPILCIHGTGSSGALWADPVAELARHGRTIAYDRRGFARSERPEPFVTNVEQHTDDAAALLEALAAAPAIVIGRSQGGEIAVDLALRYPARVRALALLEGGGLTLSATLRRWLADLLERVEAAAAVDVAGVGERFFRNVLGDEGWEALPEPAKQIFTANSRAILAEERGGLLEVTAAQLGTITCPALVVAGTDSPPGFGEAARLVADAIPSARVEWVDGGHLINPAHPAVLAFVEGVLTRGEAVSS
jgi:pimeloyl-ACP methyl ester carboxylesterase